MPSSGPPGEYIRRPRRFAYAGLSLQPQDALADGKVTYIRNMRSYMPGTLTVRFGTAPVVTGLAGAVHSLARLNDATPYAGVSAARILGAGTALQIAAVGAGSASTVSTGWSGDPLTTIAARPVNSTRPFLYVSDDAQSEKVNTDGTAYPLGIAPPVDPPSADLAQPRWTETQRADSGIWVSYGGQSSPLAPTPVTIVSKVATVVTHALYDSGTVPGMATFGLESFNNITAGMLLTIDAEDVIAHAILPPISPTTIARILYDSGTTGLCTIQPDGGFEAGQTEPVEDAVIQHRYGNLRTPLAPRLTVTRTVDYPVNCLVDVGGETVRIESATQGSDGIWSFRCTTMGTHAAGEALTGVPALRAYCTAGHGVSAAVTASAITVAITATALETPVVGGFQTNIGPPADLGRVGTRASAPDDLLRLTVRVSQMGFVQGIRLMLDLKPDPEADDEPFLSDYFFYEWRASDLVAAIQAQGEIATAQIIDAQAVAVQRGDVNTQYIDQYGNASGPFVPAPGTAGGHRQRNPGGTGTAGGGQSEPTGRYALNRDGSVPMSHGISRQLALGNNVWMTLECRIADLVRVGADTTLTLKNVENVAVYLQSTGWIEPITFELGDVFLTGGYGPDAGLTLPPYVYRYGYRSTLTGERSNVSPPMRAGVTPRRQRVSVAMQSSSSPQVDVIDLYRYGGALARWSYVGTVGNASPSYNDDLADVRIDGGEGIVVDSFQPWPIADQPRTGTCEVSGTSVRWISGDTFDTHWAPDSLIIVNDRATTLYASPSSSTRLTLVDNVGESATCDFSLPSPLLQAIPMPVIWGGAFGNVWFHFGCGADRTPGTLYWTKGNDPDAVAASNYLEVSAPSEPLLAGFFDDGQCYVFSSQQLYRIVPDFGGVSTFRALPTACTRGPWSRYAWVSTPIGTFFASTDGIYLTQGGSEGACVSNPDLQILFPQDGGGSPQSIRGIAPIDFSDPTRLRLSWVDQILYVDYLGTDGENYSLLYEPSVERWSLDVYPASYAGAITRLQEPGTGVHVHAIGAGNGTLYEMLQEQISDDVEILPWEIHTPWEHGDDPRANKQWGDYILDVNPGGALAGITVTPVTANGLLVHTPTVVGIEENIRNTYTVEINDGIGPWARNSGLLISGQCETCDEQRPILYLWEPSFLAKGVSTARRATDWEDLGYKGAKFIQGIVLRCNTFGEDKCVSVEVDSPNGDPTVQFVLTLNHDGEQAKAYPLATEGWTPFLGELVRLRGVDDADWALLDWRWVWEPAPEAATQWETQETTFDFPGYLTVHDGVLAYAAVTPVTLTVWHDDDTATYTLPDTNGIYARVYQRFGPYKGKATKFRWTAATPFRLFKRDCSVRVQAWGMLGGYAVQSPFGGPSRVDGAGV